MDLDLHGDRVARLGFGTWKLTGEECVRGVLDALEIGYRHLDTARMYENEREVGRAIADSGVDRGDMWVTTKVWYDDLEPARLRASAEASLRDLGLDHVDLLLIHWPNADVPLEATLDAMHALREEGRVRHVGVSNFPPGLFRRALDHGPVFTNQVEFHPFLAQDELLAIAAERDSSVTAYSPIAHGRALRDGTLREIGDRHGKGPAQVALRYLLDTPRTLVIPKASSHENRLANFGVFDFELASHEREAIDALPKDRRESDPDWAPDWDA